jgi:hypothetical protein
MMSIKNTLEALVGQIGTAGQRHSRGQMSASTRTPSNHGWSSFNGEHTQIRAEWREPRDTVIHLPYADDA